MRLNQKIAILRNNKHIWFVVLTMILSTAIFWFYSRYPNLNQKSVMGLRTSTLGIAFDFLFEVTSDMGPLKRIIIGSINWIYTNWKGMLFGLIFGAQVFTLLQFLRKTFPKSTFGQVLSGTLMGIPLGVCANCATPVAKSLKDANASGKTTLALISASPTLNVVALSMLFSFFPLEMVILKISFTLIYIFLAIPIMIGREVDNAETTILCYSDTTILGTIKLLLKNFIQLCWKTVPLMVIAGFCGNLVIGLIPIQWVEELSFGLISLVVVSFLGLILPVPMTFDLIASYSLLQLGVPVGLCMALLFSLGIFSIYPFLQLKNTIPRKRLLGIITIIFILSLNAGWLAEVFQQRRAESSQGKLAIVDQSKIESYIVQLCREDSRCRDNLFSYLAVESKNSSFCQGLNSNQKILDCEEEVLLKRAFFDENVCKESKNEANCYEKSYLNLATYIPPLVHWRCNQSDPLYKSYCEEALHILRAGAQDAPSSCSKEDIRPAKRDQCLENVQALRVLRSNFSTEICHLLSESKKEQCFAATNAVKFLKQGKIYSCNQLQGRWRGLCEEHLISVLVKEVENDKICKIFEKEKRLAKNCWAKFNEVNNKRLLARYYQRLIGSNRLKFHHQQESPLPDASLSSSTHILEYKKMKGVKDLEISFVPHKPRETRNDKYMFARKKMELPVPPRRLIEFKGFNSLGEGVATGDVNGDTFPDILVTHNQGFSLYINNNGKEFMAKHFPLQKFFPELSDLIDTFVGSLVDLNNDGMLDIFISTFGLGNYLFLNDGQLFKTTIPKRLPSNGEVMVGSASFGDFNGDNLVDIFMGGWTHPIPQGWHSTSKNYLLVNKGMGDFQVQNLPSYFGDTWSSIATDFNRDHKLDLLVANDFAAPDAFLIGDGKGSFKRIKRENQVFPYSPYANMSFDSADINNDLFTDIFAAEVSYGIGEVDSYCDLMEVSERKNCQNIMQGFASIDSLDLPGCQKLATPQLINDCQIQVILRLAETSKKSTYCKKIPENYENQRKYCEVVTGGKIISKFHPLRSEDIEQIYESNVLYLGSQDGKYIDATKKFGIKSSHWSWSAKFADLNNDGWQDLYIANGHHINSNIVANQYFENDSGEKFKNKSKQFSEPFHFSSKAFSYFDMDLDGDLDLVVTGLLAPVTVFENRSSSKSGNSITFDLKFKNPIGSKIYVEDEFGLKQMRELKSGGGVASFDQPIIHFGLGRAKRLKSIVIILNGGKRIDVKKFFKANRHYIIEFPKTLLLTSN